MTPTRSALVRHLRREMLRPAPSSSMSTTSIAGGSVAGGSGAALRSALTRQQASKAGCGIVAQHAQGRSLHSTAAMRIGEIPLPPLLPKRYNEDIIKRSGAYEPPPNHPVPYDYDTAETEEWNSWTFTDQPVGYVEQAIGFFAHLFIIFGAMGLAWWYSKYQSCYIPARELPYHLRACGEPEMFSGFWERDDMVKNPYTDYEGRNPYLLHGYVPGDVPTMKEAYPNGY